MDWVVLYFFFYTDYVKGKQLLIFKWQVSNRSRILKVEFHLKYPASVIPPPTQTLKNCNSCLILLCGTPDFENSFCENINIF